jgi:hypothetical protein
VRASAPAGQQSALLQASHQHAKNLFFNNDGFFAIQTFKLRDPGLSLARRGKLPIVRLYLYLI